VGGRVWRRPSGTTPRGNGSRAQAEVGPGLREILERVCLMGSALEQAEAALKLPRRAGKRVLKLALQHLARHYRMA
jgi:hypothetical protein